MGREQISNVLLVLGVALLVSAGVVELLGTSSDPLLPAFSAFFIGCTAVLDRINSQRLR